eukprot:8714961-Alexandrium_andersonii.AAC.1
MSAHDLQVHWLARVQRSGLQLKEPATPGVVPGSALRTVCDDMVTSQAFRPTHLSLKVRIYPPPPIYFMPALGSNNLD